MNKTLEKITNFAPYLIVGVTLLVTIAALISLTLSDVITGQVTGEHISKSQWFGLFVSFATTGMLIGCGALLVKFWKDSNYFGFGAVVLVFLVLQSADVYFDAVSVDIMRFGKIIFSSEMTDRPEAVAHNVYRFLVGGISLVGEPLAIGSLVMFPALKSFVAGVLKNGYVSQTPTTYPAHQQNQKYLPKHKPVHQDVNVPQGQPWMKSEENTVHFAGGQPASPLFNQKHTDRFKNNGKKPARPFEPENYGE